MTNSVGMLLVCFESPFHIIQPIHPHNYHTLMLNYHTLTLPHTHHTPQVATLGWLTRQQFEECWMHYLRVLNHVQLPQEDSSPEAIESTLVLSSCIRGMTSLIVMATLTPECGNPLRSTHLHTHRHKDITFVGSRCVCVCVRVCVHV